MLFHEIESQATTAGVELNLEKFSVDSVNANIPLPSSSFKEQFPISEGSNIDNQIITFMNDNTKLWDSKFENQPVTAGGVNIGSFEMNPLIVGHENEINQSVSVSGQVAFDTTIDLNCIQKKVSVDGSNISLESEIKLQPVVFKDNDLCQSEHVQDVIVDSCTTPFKAKTGIPVWYSGKKISPAFHDHIFWPSPPKR